ncbi:MAG: lipocalin-like domain-containing protein [Sneathiella sp.]
MKDKLFPLLIYVGLFTFLVVGTPLKEVNADGFAGLGADAQGYEQVVPGKMFVFPKDHGPHPNYKIEWWYVTANLEDENGKKYGAQWTLFRQALAPGPQKKGWDNQQIWMAHAAVTTQDQHYASELFARGGIGQANVSASPFRAWIDDWELKSTQSLSPRQLDDLHLSANGEDFSYTLTLSSTAPLILQGDTGFSLKSDEGQASYYYSAPFITVAGLLNVEGRNIKVSGSAWIDREWSSQPLSPDQTGWDWFSLHLKSGEKIMLFQLRYNDGRIYNSGNWIKPSGESELLSNNDISFKSLKNTKVQDRLIPTSWTLTIPKKKLSITTVPLNPNSWMSTLYPYWEGPISFIGSHQGVGYLEMTGY